MYKNIIFVHSIKCATSDIAHLYLVKIKTKTFYAVSLLQKVVYTSTLENNMATHILKVKEFSLLIGYAWIVNKGVPLRRPQLRSLLKILFRQGEELSEQSRYDYRVIENGNDLGIFRSKRYPMMHLSIILNQPIDSLVEQVWGYLLTELGVEDTNRFSEIIFKGYTNIESDKFAVLASQSSGLAWLLSNLLKNYVT